MPDEMNLIDNIGSLDLASLDHRQIRTLLEKSTVVGHCRVVQNLGRPNEKLIDDGYNLMTEDWRDALIDMGYERDSAVPARGAVFIALSENVTAPVAGDGTLLGEITTGGFGRVDADADGTVSHTDGENEITITNTFEASAAFPAVHKAALFNAAAGGTMAHARVFSSDANVSIGDTLTVTWTVTLG